MPLPGTSESREAFPSCVNFFWRCPSSSPQRALAFALDNQEILHNYVQQSVIFTTKLDALTLVKQVGEKLPDAPSIEDIPEVREMDELETFIGSKKTKFCCRQQ